jgi:hypothetical protein
MRRAIPALSVVLVLFTAACGGDAGTTTSTSEAASSTTEVASPTTTPQATSTTQAPTTPTTTQSSTTTTAPASTTTTLAGQPIDFGPAAGDVLMVIGVRYDDVLNLRSAPGAGQPILDGIPPTFTDLTALGHTRQLPSSFWIEVDYEGTVGWVHRGFVGYEGDVTDGTAVIGAELGETPVEPTMTALGELVAEVHAPDEESGTSIVQVTQVSMGDLAEVTYDVVGLADDAVRGVRLHIFAEEVSGGFALKSVEVTAICDRGVDTDGACV